MAAQLDASACRHLRRGDVDCTQAVTHTIYTSLFSSEEPYFYAAFRTRPRGTPANGEHAGRETILCVSELASALDFWKPG